MMNITTTHHKNFILSNKYSTCDEVFKHFNKRKKVRKKKMYSLLLNVVQLF